MSGVSITNIVAADLITLRQAATLEMLSHNKN